jgi:hypothetical protein
VTLVDRRYLEWCIGVLKVKSGRLIWSGRLTYRYISLYLSSLTCLLVGTVRLYPGPPSVRLGWYLIIVSKKKSRADRARVAKEPRCRYA